MNELACKTCKFFWPHWTADDPTVKSGECRIDAPQVVPSPRPGEHPLTLWPEVAEDLACGQHCLGVRGLPAAKEERS